MLSESDLVRRIASSFPERGQFLTVGIGDDAAVFRLPPSHEAVVTTDSMVEGRHFLRSATRPEDLGWKLAAVNLSDLAAMGAEPCLAFLAAVFPADYQEEFLSSLDGMKACLDSFGAVLAGGNISAGTSVVMTATAVGHLPAGAALLRRGASAGDGVYVTGRLGQSAAGLRLLLEGWRRDGPVGWAHPGGRRIPPGSVASSCIEKHVRPEPRITEGLWLRASGAATSCMDISDGIAADLPRLAEASGLEAVLDLAALESMASADGTVALRDVLCGGEDYELLFTARPAMESALEVDAGAVRPIRIGTMRAGCPGRVSVPGLPEATLVTYRGFDHFGGRG